MKISPTYAPIFSIREKPIIIDADLAKLFGVETRVLNQAVKRNPERFPSDFLFQLTRVEIKHLRSQPVISNSQPANHQEVAEGFFLMLSPNTEP